MGSVIDDPAYSLNKQVSNGSRSSLIISNIEFNASNGDDDLMSYKHLQNKYHVITPDHSKGSSANGNEISKLNNRHSNTYMNGNHCENVSEGIPNPKVVICPREKVILEWKQCNKIGSGLVNLGNTCFMNSVLQCLSYTPPLVNFLLHAEDISLCKVIGFCMMCEMQKHVRRTYAHSGEAIKPVYIYQRLKSIAKHFTFGRQEDAHEFLRYVIDNMWRSALTNYEHNSNVKLDTFSKETTIINHIFGGYHRSQVICLQCKEKSNTYDYFMDFMLDIKNVMTLEKALEKFVQPEILQLENAYKCPRCKRKVPLAKKQFTVFKAPNVATFQLKRFDYNRIFGGKITKPVSYPEKIDLRPYMSEPKGPPILYKLNSVLVHLGPTCNSGHYFCYVKNSNGCWYLMDDSRVSQVNLNQVLNQQAYLLFYVRVESNFNKPNPLTKNYISLQSSNLKPSIISSPEISNHQKCAFNGTNYLLLNSVTNKMVTQSPGLKERLSRINTDQIKRPQSVLDKPNTAKVERQSTNCRGLVPYLSDSSDDETGKQSSNENDAKNCDNYRRNELANDANTNVQCTSNRELPLEKNPQIPLHCNSNHSTKTNQINSLPEVNGSFSVSPLTIKVKATTTSWHVVESALQSPSVASGSSTNSVNSTTEWTITDCAAECGVNQHVKHNKLKNKNNICNHKIITAGNGICAANIKETQEHDTAESKIANLRAPLDVISNITEFKLSPVKDSHQTAIKCENFDSDLNKTSKSPIKSNDNDKEETMNKFFPRKESDSKEKTEINEKSEKVNENVFKYHNGTCDTNEINKIKEPNVEMKKKKKHHKHKLSQRSDNSDSDESIIRKHKKKKKKHKKSRHSSSDSELSSNSDAFEWVERTKDTLEKEQKLNAKTIPSIKKWNEGVKDLAPVKRKFESIDTHNEIKPQNDIVNQLSSTPLKGYGNSVNSWDGGPNVLDKSISEEKTNNINYDDYYNNDYDSGKTKKIKQRREENTHYNSKHNPFQEHSQRRHNGNYHAHYQNQRNWNDKSNYSNRYVSSNKSFKYNDNNIHRHQ